MLWAKNILGIPMLSMQDDLAAVSGIIIGMSIGTAKWEVTIFAVWHFMCCR